MIKVMRNFCQGEQEINWEVCLQMPSENLTSFFPELQKADTEINKLTN